MQQRGRRAAVALGRPDTSPLEELVSPEVGESQGLAVLMFLFELGKKFKDVGRSARVDLNRRVQTMGVSLGDIEVLELRIKAAVATPEDRKPCK